METRFRVHFAIAHAPYGIRSDYFFVNSAITLLTGLGDVVAGALEEAGATQEAIDAATNAITDSKDALAAAVAENTPSSPTAPPVDPTAPPVDPTQPTDPSVP